MKMKFIVVMSSTSKRYFISYFFVPTFKEIWNIYARMFFIQTNFTKLFDPSGDRSLDLHGPNWVGTPL